MKQDIEKSLTQGLLAGYGGKSEFKEIKRGGFKLKSSHFETDNFIYHDEWTEIGGQEIVKCNGQLITRVYAGKVASKNVLSDLGIKHKDVITNLKSRIKKLGDKTRLSKNYQTEEKDGWGYKYEILDNNKTIGVTTGKETITYKNKIVFIHCFIISSTKI